MLTVINKTPSKYIAQFTGADLKEWYWEHGETDIYICHVVMKKCCEHLGRRRGTLCLDSQEMINMLRVAVPNRFMTNPPYSSTVHRHMLQKYCSLGNNSNFRTRKNLISAVADDFMFTLPLTIE